MNVPPRRESPAALDPLNIPIATLPESTVIPDPDIELPGPGSEEEDEYLPAEEPTKMTTPEYKAGLPDDFSRKNEDAM